MSQKLPSAPKPTAFQKQIARTVDSSKQISEAVQKTLSFDCLCTNDYCSAKNGKRTMASAWKNSDGLKYNVYCSSCGSLEEFDKESFSKKKTEMTREESLHNMEKLRKKKEG